MVGKMMKMREEKTGSDMKEGMEKSMERDAGDVRRTRRDLISDIEDLVCRSSGLTRRRMFTRRRERPLVDARYILFYLLNTVTCLTEPEISRLYAYDRTTVIHGVQRVRDDMKIYSGYCRTMEGLTDEAVRLAVRAWGGVGIEKENE